MIKKRKLNVELEYNWRKVHEFKFPNLYPGHKHPAIYTWVITSKKGGRSYYIGQTSSLTRRVHYYMKPGPTQMTNIRINSEMRLSKNVELYILEYKIKINGKSVSGINIQDVDIRKGLESLLIHELRIQKSGHPILNLS